jgi:hypothetical protein
MSFLMNTFWLCSDVNKVTTAKVFMWAKLNSHIPVSHEIYAKFQMVHFEWNISY